MSTPSARSKPVREALAACRRHLRDAALFSAFLNLLYLAPALYMLQVYDRVVPTRGFATLALLTLMLLLAAGTMAALDLLRGRLLVRAGVRLDRLLVRPLLARMLSPGGDAARQKPMRDLDTLRQALAGAGTLAILDAPWAPIYVLVCFLLHPALGALALGGAAILVAIAFANERASGRAQRLASATQAHAMASLDASAQLGPAAAAAAAPDALAARHVAEREAASVALARAAMSAQPWVTASKTVRQLLQSLAIALGAVLAMDQAISAGAIFAASLLVARALAPIEQITASWRALTAGHAAWRALDATLAHETPPAAVRLPDMQGALSVDRLVVAGGPGQPAILRGVSFDLPAGEILGIVGPNGAGKSTLARALAGLAPLESGAIRIDGAALADWPLDQRAAATGYVPQEPRLLPGTILANIARFEPGEIDERAVRAARLAGAHQAILAEPGGYGRQVGGVHGALSLGQTQRVALARAVYGDPALVILDEPYAHLDAGGEAALVLLLDTLRACGTTVVLVAHRFQLLERCDRLLLLRNGQMESYGRAADILGAQARTPELAKAA